MLFAEFQPLGQEQVQHLAVAAGGGNDLAQGQEGLRLRAGLLLQLPQGPCHRVLAGVQLAGRQFCQHPAEHVPVLPDNQHPVGLVHGQHRRAVHMVHHFPDGLPAVGQAHVVHMHLQNFSVVNIFPPEGDLRQILWHFHSINLV